MHAPDVQRLVGETADRLDHLGHEVVAGGRRAEAQLPPPQAEQPRSDRAAGTLEIRLTVPSTPAS